MQNAAGTRPDPGCRASEKSTNPQLPQRLIPSSTTGNKFGVEWIFSQHRTAARADQSSSE